jgi:hypothetical protein
MKREEWQPIAQLDAIAVGDKITVVENLRHPQDKSFQGDMLVVRAVDSPFVIVQPRYTERPFSLDARLWVFKKFSPEAIAALESTRTKPQSAGIAPSAAPSQQEP